MHPVAATDALQIPDCADAINALKQCHKDRYLAKFIGICNEQRSTLDQCLRVNKEIKRLENHLKSSIFDKEKKADMKVRMAHLRKEHKDILH